MLISVLTRFASNFSISLYVFSSLLINWFWTNEVNMHMHSNIVENHCTICSLQSHFSAEIYEETLRQKKLVLVFQEQQKPTIAKNLCTILILVPLVSSACKWRQIVTTRNWSVGQKSLDYMSQKCNCFERRKKNERKFVGFIPYSSRQKLYIYTKKYLVFQFHCF